MNRISLSRIFFIFRSICQLKELGRQLEYLTKYYIFVRCLDGPGILRNLFQLIAVEKGNIVHFRQDLLRLKKDDFANIHLIAVWEKQEDDVPDEKSLKIKINKMFSEDVFKNKVENAIKAIRVKKRERVDKTLGKFAISFLDERGMAGKIVEIFSSRNISVVESSYRMAPESRIEKLIDGKIKVWDVGKMVLFSDLTDKQDQLELLTNGIRSLSGVFDVRSSVVNGIYSL